ncbi:conserved hypothetical protein [Bradyrhizobium oligotrophicum S58]|uniref:Uncharacterized protein n=1 Tax=Bradyrhizobium oligotrophicum S58 TaxID=1245469 RepID=M4ZNA4_9BRAD|nr:hypothetical protein [Bradyrhizobium oligotrophicum]BAM87700.1 conserved hypothetical protein [Bradyrhizobium oligotrophicum S58]
MMAKLAQSMADKLGFGDLLWQIATSDGVLLLVAGLIVIAALVGHFPVLSKLSALQQYVIPAKLAVYAVIFLFAFLLGFRTADDRAEAKALRADVARKAEVIAAKDFDLRLAIEATEVAQKQRDEAALRAKEAQDEIDDYAQRLQARPNASCLLAPSDFPGGLPDDGKR